MGTVEVFKKHYTRDFLPKIVRETKIFDLSYVPHKSPLRKRRGDLMGELGEANGPPSRKAFAVFLHDLEAGESLTPATCGIYAGINPPMPDCKISTCQFPA
jgi:hypothetical protein